MTHNFVVCGNRVTPDYMMSYSGRNRIYTNRLDDSENDESYGYEYSFGHAQYSSFDIEAETRFLEEMSLEPECYED